MYKIGVIGEEDMVTGWNGLGVSAIPIKEDKEVEENLERAVRDGCKIILISEDFVQPIFQKIDEISVKENVCISIIPGRGSFVGKHSPYLWKRIKKYAEKAIGADISGEGYE